MLLELGLCGEVLDTAIGLGNSGRSARSEVSLEGLDDRINVGLSDAASAPESKTRLKPTATRPRAYGSGVRRALN